MKLPHFISFCFILTLFTNLSLAGIKVTNLKSNFQQSVFFSWQIQSDQRSQVQSAYEIWVSDSPVNLKKTTKLIWNSGKVKSGQSNLVQATETSFQPFAR